MKAKDRRRLEREAEEIRKESGLPTVDVRKLIASDATFRGIILDAARKAEPRNPVVTKTGGDSD